VGPFRRIEKLRLDGAKEEERGEHFLGSLKILLGDLEWENTGLKGLTNFIENWGIIWQGGLSLETF